MASNMPMPRVMQAQTSNGTALNAFDCAAADTLLSSAQSQAEAKGLAWDRKPITLTPSAKLADLIRRSRELAATQTGDDVGAD